MCVWAGWWEPITSGQSLQRDVYINPDEGTQTEILRHFEAGWKDQYPTLRVCNNKCFIVINNLSYLHRERRESLSRLFVLWVQYTPPSPPSSPPVWSACCTATSLLHPETLRPLKSSAAALVSMVLTFNQRLTWNVHDDSPCFSNNGGPSGHVPAVDAHVVIGISRATCYQTHVDGCTARGSDSGEEKSKMCTAEVHEICCVKF